MKHRDIILATVLVCAAPAMAATHRAWPKLQGDTHSTPCTEAFKIAKATFDSDSFYLYAPPTLSQDLQSTLVLKPIALDISGGDALQADASIFDKMPRLGERANRSIYWQKAAQQGHRLVIQEEAYGWRGDQYMVFVIAENIKASTFLADDAKELAASKYPLIAGGWRPPLVFKDNQSQQLWVIDVGSMPGLLPTWYIHALQADGIKQQCVIQFRPALKHAVDLLPTPVRKLNQLLDQAIGPGNDEGTLQPTARLRIKIEHTWANAALRPWSLEAPYNSRADIDEGLKNWSHVSQAHLKLHQSILNQYPLAEKALARFYEQRFHKKAPEARLLAAYVMDIAIRSSYTFHRVASDDHPASNPWRNGAH